MKNVGVKEVETKSKEEKKPVAKSANKNPGLVKFMESRNEARKAAKLKPAYSEEQIKAYK